MYQASSSSLTSTDIEINDDMVGQKSGRHMPFTYIVGYNSDNSGDEGYNDDGVASSSHSTICKFFWF